MICSKCDGRGKLRHNKMIDGKYIFGSIICDKCNGTGKSSLFAVDQAIAQRLCSVIRCRPLDREFICMCDFKNISFGYESVLYDMRVYSWYKIGFIMIGIGRDAVKGDFV